MTSASAGFGDAAALGGGGGVSEMVAKERESRQPQKGHWLASDEAENWQRGQSMVTLSCRRCGCATRRI